MREGAGGHLHRGALVLEQPHRHSEHGESAQAPRLPLQEGHRDLQLLLLEHGAVRAAQPQPAGRVSGGAYRHS